MANRGYNCTLSIGGTICGKARNVEVTETIRPQDITVRENLGYVAEQGGLKQLTFTVEALWVPTDTALAALMTAKRTRVSVAFVLMAEDSSGWTGSCIITELRRSENIENAVMLNATCHSTGTYQDVSGSTTWAP